MGKLALVILVGLFLFCGTSSSQVGALSPPVKLDLGIGGGVSVPAGNYSSLVKTGWHAGAKARISGFLPMNIIASGTYNRLPLAEELVVPAVIGADTLKSESDVAWMIGAGLEYALPAVVVKPYVGVDALVNVLTSTAADAQSVTREGLGIGAGVAFTIPSLGSFDTSVKYQIFNLFGKEEGEENASQVIGNVCLMFSIL